ncbi:hypothetical protein JCM10207_005898 [Rhodosporidiobolus poonsookiae]
MPPPTPLSHEPTLKRIHVGNLAPSVTPRELVQRFSSFGTVKGGEAGVDGLGTNQLGFPRTYAFFNLETTDAKFARCMSMLNGSMWKAHKLRIGPAKATWEERRAAERAAAKEADEAPPPRPKKRKRSKDPNVGMLARHFELVTDENLQRHSGWLLDPKPAPSPLFPLVLRPPHPLELPAKPAATAWTRGKAKAKPSKAAREAARLGVELEKPLLRRAKRMRIDPRRWGRSKVVFDRAAGESSAAGGAGANMLSVGTWECEESAAGADGEPQVTWVFKARDGTVRLRETVRLSQQTAYTDRFTALLERMNRPGASDAAPPPPAPPALDSAPDSDASTDPATDSDADAPAARARSASPPPYVPAAPRALIYNEEDAFQLVAAALDDSERAAAHAMERSELVRLARGAVEEVGDQEAEAQAEEAEVQGEGEGSKGAKLPKVEGFADDSDDDSDLFPALRLRGGGGVDSGSDSSSSSDQDDSDSDSSSDSDSDSDDEEEEKDGSEGSSRTEKQETDGEDVKMGEVAAPEKKTAVVKGSLKDLFKPQEETGGFSLVSGLDLDLAPLERTPSPEPEAVPIPLPSAAPARPAPVYSQQPFRARSQQQQQATGPAAPFFAFPSGAFEDRATGEVSEEAGTLGLSEVALQRTRAESENRLGEAAKEFWRHEGMDKIEEDHQKLRELLRGQARKRHREAVKRSKKKAGRRGAGGGLDIVDDE